RRIIDEEIRNNEKKALWSSIKEGEKRKGKVTRLAKFGAFVDIFGLIGEDPGQSWTDTYPYTQAAGGAYWTRDQTLIRKPGITQGVTTNPGTPYTGAWNPTAEWDSLPRNTFNQLGFHQCDCGMLAGINNHNPLANNFTMYPNPTTGNLYFEAPKLVSQVQILTLAGLETTAIKPNSQKFTLNTSDLPQGTYFVKLQYIDKTMYLRKVVVQ
ncbi:MAG TPA: T9SS type A sorting domain-containing protein, partial [Chitinophagales bacterium]|nr:T9SS type A sorting domain-containing protein [Chitinophagales bacterium]